MQNNTRDLHTGVEVTRARGCTHYTAAPSGYCNARRSSLASSFDRRSSALPGAVGLEPQVANAPAPWRNHAADGPEVGAFRMLLIEPAHDVGRDTNERPQRRRDRMLYLRPFQAAPNTSATCLK